MRLPISIFKYLFEHKKLFAEVRAEEKEKNLFAEVRAEEKEKTTRHSSRNQSIVSNQSRAVAAGERREEEKKEEEKQQKHHSKHQSYVCNHETI